MTRVTGVSLTHLDLPLIQPYVLSYRTFESFEPFLIAIETDDGQLFYGEQHISPGSSSETQEGGWLFLTAAATEILNCSLTDAHNKVQQKRQNSPVAASACLNALDQALHPQLWSNSESLSIPILSAFSAMTELEIAEELELRLSEGFQVFKVKVGKDVQQDQRRVRSIQRLLGNRGHIRVDANRSYSVDDAISFSSVLNPDVCELFEQPCDASDWEGNGRVAKASPVPLMLDEPICTSHDIERAASISGVGFCKLKLKRFGSLNTLCEAIEKATLHGLKVVLGDGLGSDINCYLEALVSYRYLDRAGEFNGCLKIRNEARILQTPLTFCDGHMIIPSQMTVTPDQSIVEARTVKNIKYGTLREKNEF